jgi:pimeloyl-ACP methyl ester carboxylesterase
MKPIHKSVNRSLSIILILSFVTVTWLSFAPPVQAADSPIRYLSGFQSFTLTRNDDSYTSAIPIGFTVNFFGKQHDTLYVNNNGNITFDSPQSTYTPYDLTSTTREIIAAFFADVDTRGTGSQEVTYGYDTINGRPAFGVNYVNVGYYSYRTDKLNSFQLILIDRSDVGPGDFDIEFNYEKIQWETGDASAGAGGLGGYSARVGFSNGTRVAGTFFELPGSAVNGSFLDTNLVTGLKYNSFASGVPGRYNFEARNGAINISHNPLIFIPGIGGSELRNDPNKDGQTTEVWLNTLSLADPFDSFLQVLKLDDSGTGPYYPANPSYSTVVPGEVLDTRIKDIYSSTINYFTGQRGYQKDRDFILCSYDWRKDVADIAAGGLSNTLDKCINKALNTQWARDNGKTKVDILAHSMGGLVARYYISDPARAQKVDHLVTLGTPYLGAPKITLAVLDKLCFIPIPYTEIESPCMLNRDMLHGLVQNFPSSYELSPGNSYFQVYPDGYIYRAWDKNGDHNDDGWLSYQDTSSLLNEHNKGLVTKATNYYGSAGGWNNHGGTNGVNVLMIVGSGLQTPLKLKETRETSWSPPFDKYIVYTAEKLETGDGTVPVNSANMKNISKNVDLSAGVSTVYFKLDHGELPKNSQALQVAATFFESNGNLAGSASQLAAFQREGTCIPGKDTDNKPCMADLSANLQSSDPSLDPIPLNGKYLLFNGAATVEVWDEHGNRIGLVDDVGGYEINIPGAGFYPLNHAFSVFLPNDHTYDIVVHGQAQTEVLARIQDYSDSNVSQTTVYKSMMMSGNSYAYMYFDPNSPAGSFFVDQDGDGTYDEQVGVQAVLDGQQSTDSIAPKTTISIQGTPTGTGWYEGMVQVAITAEDNPGGVGVDRIEYSFDNGQTVQEYTGPFILNANTYWNVRARSIDRAGNSSWETACACADVDVSIGGAYQGMYNIRKGLSTRQSFESVDKGPVKMFSENGGTSILASERFIYSYQNSKAYAEMIGYPDDRLATEYWFPWYNNKSYSTQLRVSNMGGNSAEVKVYAGGSLVDTFTLAAGEAKRTSYVLDQGPLHVVSTDGTTKILVSERFIQTYQASASYSEMMGYPGGQLATEYWFPWYNNKSYSTQLRVSNMGNISAEVKVYAGSSTIPIDTFTLGAGEAKRIAYNIDNGPLHVVSTDHVTPILASERFILTFGSSASYAEMMGYPGSQLATQYCFPWYNNTTDGALTLSSQLRVSNMGTSGTAQVTVYLAGTQLDSFSLDAGQGARKTYASYNNGPLCVVSTDGVTPILASERFISTYLNSASYSEMMGYSSTRLDDMYWFPWYNNISYQTELRIAKP